MAEFEMSAGGNFGQSISIRREILKDCWYNLAGAWYLLGTYLEVIFGVENLEERVALCFFIETVSLRHELKLFPALGVVLEEPVVPGHGANRKQIFAREMTVPWNVVVGLPEAAKVFAKLVPVVEGGLFKEEDIGPEVHGVEFLVEVDFAHVFGDFGHDVFAHGAHDEHSEKREVVVVSDEVLVFEVGVWVVLDQDVMDVAVVVEVEDAHVGGVEVHFLVRVVVVHFGLDWG